MQRIAFGRLAVDLPEELQPFSVSGATGLAEDLVVKRVERRDQRGRIVALVVVRAAARPFFIGGPGCMRSSACTWSFSSVAAQHHRVLAKAAI